MRPYDRVEESEPVRRDAAPMPAEDTSPDGETARTFRKRRGVRPGTRRERRRQRRRKSARK